MSHIEMPMRTEDRFIASICGFNPHPTAAAERLSEIQFDWKYVRSRVEKSGLESIFYYRLKEYGLEYCVEDKAFLEELRDLYFATKIRNTVIAHAALDVFVSLNRKGVDFIPLRTFDSIYRFYRGNLAVRRINDIDMMIQKKDLSSFKQIMLGKRYKAVPYLQDAYSFERNVAGINASFDVRVNMPYVNTEEFWNNSEIYHGPIFAYRVFKPEYDLLYNVMHAFYQHGTDPLPLSWMLDIHNIIDYYKDGIDWQGLARLAHRFKAEHGLYRVLASLKKDFDTPIPEMIIQKAPPLRLSDRFIMRTAHRKTRRRQLLLSLLTLYGLRNKSRFLFENLFPGKDWMKGRYKTRIRNVHILYLVRLFGGLRKLLVGINEDSKRPSDLPAPLSRRKSADHPSADEQLQLYPRRPAERD